MSRRTHTETVPFAIRRVWCGEEHFIFRIGPDVLKKQSEAFKGDGKFVLLNEWTHSGLEEELAMWRSLVAGVWEKNRYIVYEVNESEYSIVGFFEQTYFSESREALEAFIIDCCQDIEPKPQIEENVAIQQIL